MRRVLAATTLSVLLALGGGVISLVLPGTGPARSIANAIGYYDRSSLVVIDNHGCGNAGHITAFGVFWIGGPVPPSWVSPGAGSTPHPGTLHQTSFSHAIFTAPDGGAVKFTHHDGQFFDSLDCALQ